MKFTVLFILIAFQAMASEESELLSCQKNAELFHDGHVNTKIKENCAKLFFKRAPLKNKWLSPKKDLLVFGLNNIIFMHHHSKTPLSLKKYLSPEKNAKLSGTRPRLQKIHALKVNAKDKHIVTIVNDTHSVHSYLLDAPGNIDPVQFFENTHTRNCTNLGIDYKLKRLALVCPEVPAIRFFNLKASKDGRVPEKGTDLLAEIKGSSTMLENPLDIAMNNQSIFVLDNKRLLIYNLDSIKDSAPKKVISLTTQFVGLQIIDQQVFGITKQGQYKEITP